jgi:hypothetical protein
MAAVVEATAPAVIWKEPEVAPAGIVTDGGSWTTAGATLNAITASVLGAPAVSVTVQVATAPWVKDWGAQDKPLKLAGCKMVTVLPVAVIPNEIPDASAAEGLTIWIADEVFVVEVDTVSDT